MCINLKQIETVAYRYLKDPAHLKFALKALACYQKNGPNLSANLDVPIFDFKAPPGSPLDTSAAAIVASALADLATLVPDTHTPAWHALS